MCRLFSKVGEEKYLIHSFANNEDPVCATTTSFGVYCIRPHHCSRTKVWLQGFAKIYILNNSSKILLCSVIFHHKQTISSGKFGKKKKKDLLLCKKETFLSLLSDIT